MFLRSFFKKLNSKYIFTVSCLYFVGQTTAMGQTLPSTPFSVERLNDYPLIQGRSPSTPSMAPNGSKIVFGWNKTGERKLDVYVLDYPNGTSRKIVDSDSISDLPNQDDLTTPEEKKEKSAYDAGISGFEWSPDSKEISFSYKGRIWLVKPDGSDLRALFDAANGARNAKYSPDGNFIAYAQGQNLYKYDRKTGHIKELTFISKPQTMITGYEWSPDSENLSVNWENSSKSGKATMIDFTKDRGKAVEIDRDWVGTLSTDQQIGVVSVNGGLIHFVDGIPAYSWPSSISWSPNGDSLAIGWFSGDFQKYTISLAPWPNLKSIKVYSEVAPKNFLPDWRPVLWQKDGKHIVFGTDVLDGKFGFRSILQVTPDGKEITKLFAKNYDVGAVTRPKDSEDLILVTSARSPLETEIQTLDSKGVAKEYDVSEDGYSTGKNFDDAALPLFSDNGSKIATMASDRKLNPELYSVTPKIKRLTFSQLDDFKKIQWANVKEVTFPGPEGAIMHGLLFTNPNMDMSQQHPAVISDIYADSGKASWGGFLENYMAMNLNMSVLCVDFRASWGYGGEFDSGYYKKMGLIDADEAVDARTFLASQKFVNPTKIGIWGWSYGGYLTCMTLMTKPGNFAAGVAVAPVTDWTTYNEWYTRRRLGLPKDDPDIYKKTSPITYASGLQDHLLIVHGVVDNNVLFENTAIMVENIIKAEKYVDLMIYPKDDHSISRIHSRPNVMGRIIRYLDTWLNH